MRPDGFAVNASVFSEDELSAVEGQLAVAPLKRSRAGARHLLRIPGIATLARHPHLLELAAAELGGEAIPFGATLFDKSSRSNWLVVWHQDTALPLRERRDVVGWGPWTTKDGVAYAHAPAEALSKVVALRVHLDDSGPDNGPLRVLPGTHTLGVLNDDQIREAVSRVDAVSCIVPRGGVLLMRPLLLHSSSKASVDGPRRVIHLEYAATTDMGSGIQVRT